MRKSQIIAAITAAILDFHDSAQRSREGVPSGMARSVAENVTVQVELFGACLLQAIEEVKE